MPMHDPDAEEEESKEAILNINRTMDIPDEALQRQIELEAIAKEETQRDKTFEEFLNSFGGHLAGEIDPKERIGDRPVTAYGDDAVSQSPKKDAGRKSQMSANPADDDDARSKLMSKKGSIASQHASSQNGENSAVRSDFKYDIPNDAKLEFLRHQRISKLDDNYVLVAHPYP